MFTVYVFRCAMGDATNGGISSRMDTLRVLRPDEPAPANPQIGTCREERRGADHYALIPLDAPAGFVGPMFGGNLATTSNAAGNHAPGRVWKIHDRFESPELYASMD